MKKLPVSKQITLGLIVAGVAAVTSFLLAFMAAASSRGADLPAPSPLIGLCFGVVVGGMYLGLSGNRRVAFADEAARRAALAPAAGGTARLLVYREGFIGKLAGVDVHVDGEVRTQLKSPRFAALDVSPGSHTLVSEVHDKRSKPLALTVSANQIAAVQIVVSLFGKTRLVQQDAEAVRPKLAHVPMVQA